MVFEELIVGSSPFLIGTAVLIGMAMLLGALRAPLEIVVLTLFPVTFIVIGDLIGGISPILTLISGLLIGLFFLAIVRR